MIIETMSRPTVNIWRLYFTRRCTRKFPGFFGKSGCRSGQPAMWIWSSGTGHFWTISPWLRFRMETLPVLAIWIQPVIWTGCTYIATTSARGLQPPSVTGWSRQSRVRRLRPMRPLRRSPFFLHRGYRVLREQQVIRGGIALTNYVMEKEPQATCQEEI